MGTEPPAQYSLLGLRGRLHGLDSQRLGRFDVADDGADQFVSSRCCEAVSGLFVVKRACLMQHAAWELRDQATVAGRRCHGWREVRCSGQGGVVACTRLLYSAARIQAGVMMRATTTAILTFV
jgi:hypothetical protein